MLPRMLSLINCEIADEMARTGNNAEALKYDEPVRCEVIITPVDVPAAGRNVFIF